MLEHLQERCFLEKALAFLLRSKMSTQEDCDRHRTLFQDEVLSAIHTPNQAVVQLRYQAVIPYLLADISILFHHSYSMLSHTRSAKWYKLPIV